MNGAQQRSRLRQYACSNTSHLFFGGGKGGGGGGGGGAYGNCNDLCLRRCLCIKPYVKEAGSVVRK